MDKALYIAAQNGHLVLTVNDRLSRSLSLQYDSLQQEAGRSAWLRPEILSLNAWLSRAQQQIPDLPVLLNNSQLQWTWELVVQEDVNRSGSHLLQVPQTARRALQAHHLLVKYSADFDPDRAAEDHRAFLRWRAQWRALAEKNHWHDPVELPQMITRAVLNGEVDAPRCIILAGFDEISPDVQRLLDAFANVGTNIEHWHPRPCRDGRRMRVSASDMSEEVRLCARWVRQNLSHNPEAVIGVVVPQLEAYQSHIENIFSAELTPRQFVNGDESQHVFNLSLGHGLDQEGVVFAALKLLKLGMQMSQEDASWLFCMPYLGKTGKENAGRALIDSEVRKARRVDWQLSRLIRLVQQCCEKKSMDIRSLQSCLNVLSEDLGRSKRKQMPGAWAEHFTLLLDRLGWPGDRGLSSREYQAVEQFRMVLGEFASLDGVSGQIDRSEAVRVLSRMASSHEFQAEGGDAPVQVLGELESAGMTFNHLWVLGLHDGALPKPPSPNPFIPLPVQRQKQMQRADVEREHQFAEQLAKRLLSAAPDVVVSWPMQNKGAAQRPSPFIADMPTAEPLLAESGMPARLFWANRPDLDEEPDNLAPALSTRKPFTGGTGIIKDQALCPFRAFAHHRLHAVAMDIPDIGIDNMSRGSLAHSVLEFFWTDAGDQETLLSLDDLTLRSKVQAAAELALKRLEKEQRHNLPDCQRRIESERLQSIVIQWLELERQRSSFRVVSAEQSHQVKVGSLTIRTRIDRIDELADGTRAVIDYKTGRPDPSQWLGARITEPQLPIYSLNLPPQDVGAVMFAEVRSKMGECGFRGLARTMDSWPGSRSRKIDDLLEANEWISFEDVLQHWRTALPELGDAFARGEAAVDPIDVDLACKYCDLTGLCRVMEFELDGAGEDNG